MRYLCFVLIFILILPISPCFADCTSFCLVSGDTILLGNTLDWYICNGLIVVNKRNVKKTAMFFSNAPTWISKYGSITINQWGRECAARGMNEAGLAMGEMTLPGTRFPDSDSRAAIPLLQWMQYQLDNCATVEEILATDHIIRIGPDEYPSHFFAADSSGRCVSLEWLNGELVAHKDDELPVTVLTNITYSTALEYYNTYDNNLPQSDFLSQARFCRAAEMIKNYRLHDDTPVVDYAFQILDSVAPPDWNKWKVVFDIAHKRFYYSTDDNPAVRYLDFHNFDFSCDTPVKILDANAPGSGNVSGQFVDFNYQANFELIDYVVNYMAPYVNVGGNTDLLIQTLAMYPNSTSCVPSDSNGMIAGPITDYKLYDNYPNPFNPLTKICFDLPEAVYVNLKIFNLKGQEIEILVNSNQTGGRHYVQWTTEDLASGIYFARLHAGEFLETIKLVVNK